MTKREQLIKDGYYAYTAVVPKDICERAAASIRSFHSEKFVWADQSVEFRYWCQPFLTAEGWEFDDGAIDGLGNKKEVWYDELHAFDRSKGSMQFWHHDGDGGCPGARRVFVCTNFVDTTKNNAAFRVIPTSHNNPKHLPMRERGTQFRLDGVNDHELTYPEFYADHADQLVLELPAGSIVICDERILHGTTTNVTEETRPMALWWLWKAKEDWGLPGG